MCILRARQYGWYGPVRIRTDRDNPRIHNLAIWDVLRWCKVRDKMCKLRAWSEHVRETLCILRANKKKSGREASKGNQEDPLWRQAANESKDGADWLLWRMDRLALAVKQKGGTTMNMVWMKAWYMGAYKEPMGEQPSLWPVWISQSDIISPQPITRHHTDCNTKLSSTPSILSS